MAEIPQTAPDFHIPTAMAAIAHSSTQNGKNNRTGECGKGGNPKPGFPLSHTRKPPQAQGENNLLTSTRKGTFRRYSHPSVQDRLVSEFASRFSIILRLENAPGPVWHVREMSEGKIGNIARKEPWPYVNHYFHIMDPDWGSVTVRMCGHPPFNAQIILNGHEFIACQSRAMKPEPVEFVKEGNCFIPTSNPKSLQKAADT